ncbi:MAG TPA: MBL fold metallo-hydrolase [Vicinamibacterales bacterium]|jgi:glyoxylase-like metal-dependent hydrolase (beta-lactamase superfamily II)|nr:MBL fold metallo-hydrolase [Vicinamibacterales bacterium]
MQLVFEQIRAGGDRNFGYLLGDRDARQAVLIDPSYSPELFVTRAEEQGLAVTHVINTHGHEDHVNGNATATALTGAAIAAHPACPSCPGVAIADGDGLSVGSLRLQFMYVPGHAADHVTVYEARHNILITGDLMFVGKVGGTRTDEDARVEWDSLQRVLAAIPDAATVWPGHDYGARPSSTIALEKETNPFLRCADLAAFLQLKRDWADYKKRLGLK